VCKACLHFSLEAKEKKIIVRSSRPWTTTLLFSWMIEVVVDVALHFQQRKSPVMVICTNNYKSLSVTAINEKFSIVTTETQRSK